MGLIDHISVGVPDIKKARTFYDAVFAEIGVRCFASADTFATYGIDRVEFLLLLPFDGNAPTAGNGTHIGLAAGSREAVVNFHNCALRCGGKNEGEPGFRDAYPMDGVYAAYVRDPFGNKLEVICNGFSVDHL